MKSLFEFIHITDTHLGPDKNFSIEVANPYHQTELLLSRIQKNYPEVPLIIHTGDIAHAEDDGAYTLAAELFASLNARVVFIPGNHDNLASIQEMCQSESRWTTVGHGPGLLLDYQDVRIIALNSNNEGVQAPRGKLSEETLTFIKGALENSPHPVVLALHHPPLPVGCRWIDDSMLLQDSEAFFTLLSIFREQIRAVIHGHIHTPSFCSVHGVPIIGAPSGSVFLDNFAETQEPIPIADGPTGCNIVRVWENHLSILPVV